MKKEFFEHQKTASEWAKVRSQAAFFMEMRLGKTLVSIRWAESFNPKLMLVVCPLPVTYVWQKELFEEEISSALLIGSWKQKIKMLEDRDVRWWITNYESLYIHKKKGRPGVSFLHRIKWDGILLDESTYIRNPKAIRTKMTRKYIDIPIKGILTGLPNPESPMDYFEQLAFLHGSFLNCSTFWEFRYRFFEQGSMKWDWYPKANTISLIKEEVEKRAFVLSRKQAKIGSKKIYEQRYVILPSKLRKAYDKAEAEFELGEQETKWVLVVRTWLARLCGGCMEEKILQSNHKIKEVMTLLEGELKKEQVLIWFKFNKELEQMHLQLQKNKITNNFIIGEMQLNEREKVRIDFRNNKFRCLLMQIKCGKFGLDCSNASVAIYYSNSLEYEERSQSEDRIISPIKKEPVLIMDILVKDSIDEDSYLALKTKGMNSKLFSSTIIKKLLKRRKRKC